MSGIGSGISRTLGCDLRRKSGGRTPITAGGVGASPALPVHSRRARAPAAGRAALVSACSAAGLARSGRRRSDRRRARRLRARRHLDRGRHHAEIGRPRPRLHAGAAARSSLRLAAASCRAGRARAASSARRRAALWCAAIVRSSYGGGCVGRRRRRPQRRRARWPRPPARRPWLHPALANPSPASAAGASAAHPCRRRIAQRPPPAS